MSAHVTEQSFQYVGILNGVMYRIDPSSGGPAEPMFGTQAFKKWYNLDDNKASAASNLMQPAVPQLSAAPVPAPTAAVAEAVIVERVAAPPSNLFPRSGAEPLRAGHPDLWALLVAGTCLEGCAYVSP
jgi:hypothetical protein